MEYDYARMAISAKNFIKLLESNKIDAKIKASRYLKDIKAVEVSSSIPIEDLLQSIGVSGKVKELSSEEEKNISGKYKAKLVTLTNRESFFIVNTYTSKGSIKTKELAPEKFGLIKNYSSTSSFDDDVRDGIKKISRIEPNVKIVLNGLFNAVTSSSGNVINYDKKLANAFSTIKPQDVQAIGKDFGEILSLRWCANQQFTKGYKSFAFSAISNEPLVDFYFKIQKKNIENLIKVSAKFEKGAAPSIKAISENLDKVYKNPTKEQKNAIDVLKSLAGVGSVTTNTSTKILNAFKTLNLPAYKVLQTIMKKQNITLDDLNNFIGNIAKSNSTPDARIKAFNKTFEKYYSTLGKDATMDSLKVVFAGKTYSKGYYSPIISPMGYSLVDYMNRQPLFQEILNNVSRQLNVDQVYLYLKSNSMVFEKKVFSESKFKFSYGANAKDSNNTGIKFSYGANAKDSNNTGIKFSMV